MKSSDINEGILVTSLPFIGYLTAYFFEKSYLSYYGIPSYLIKLSLDQIIASTSVIAIGLLITYYTFFSIVAPLFYSLRENVIMKKLLPIILGFGGSLPFIITFSNATLLVKMLQSLVMFLILTFFNLGLMYVLVKDKALEQKTINTKINKTMRWRIMNNLFSKPKLRTFLQLFLITICAATLANLAGTKEASSQSDYLVFNTNSTYAVLRSYGEKLVSIRINLDSKTMGNEILILSNNKDLELKLESVGPLKKQ